MVGSKNYCWERVKAGAATGGVLGLCIGTMYGLYGVIGLRDVGMGARMQLLARTVAASAVSFGFFLAIGSAIRCEPSRLENYPNSKNTISPEQCSQMFAETLRSPTCFLMILILDRMDDIDLLYDDNAFGAADSYEDLTGLSESNQQKRTSEIDVDLSHTELYTDKRRNSVSGQQQNRQTLQQAHISTDGFATNALYISGLAWWITDLQLQGLVGKAGLEKQLRLVAFLEHRINGKSRGVAYVELSDHQSAAKVKESIERNMKNTQAYFVHTSQIGPIPFRNLPLQNSAGVPIAISGIEPPQQQQISRPTSSLQDRRPSSNKY